MILTNEFYCLHIKARRKEERARTESCRQTNRSDFSAALFKPWISFHKYGLDSYSNLIHQRESPSMYFI